MAVISIHTAREGCDEQGLQQKMKVLAFQPTHPVRGATSSQDVQKFDEIISIHAPREECDDDVITKFPVLGISIHTPREGCDCV